MDAGLEHEATHTPLLGGGLEAGQYSSADPLTPLIRFHVHPLRLGSGRVEKTDGATPYRPAIVAGDEKDALAALQMFGFEVRPEALLGRIQLGQAGVQGGDQSLRIAGVKLFRGNRQAQDWAASGARAGSVTRSVICCRTAAVELAFIRESSSSVMPTTRRNSTRP